MVIESTRNRLALSLLATVALTAAACDRSAASTQESGKPKSTTSAPSASAAKADGGTRPWVNEVGRQGKCQFVRWEGTGKDRKAIFDLKAPAGKEVEVMQTWEFYYDKTGKEVDSYPHATTPEKEPQALGQTGDHIDKATEVVECEITSIRYRDHSFWFNGNLVPLNHERPKGGYTEADLKLHAGEKVEVEIVDAKKGSVKLKNVSDKEVKHLEVDILYFKADGSHDYKTDYIDVSIKPGDSIAQDIKLGGEPLAAFTSAEGTAPEVRFADDTEWKNRNLEAFERP